MIKVLDEVRAAGIDKVAFDIQPNQKADQP